MDLTPEAKIWNRACSDQPGTAPGDQHLASLIRVHSIIMNGGIDHARDVRDADEFVAAANAAEYFGLNQAAAMMRHMASYVDATSVDNSIYFRSVRDDGLLEAFAHRRAESPEDFDSPNRQ